MWHPENTKTHVSISFITGTVEDWITQGAKIGSPTSTNPGSVTGPFHTMEPKEILISEDESRALATTLISIHMRVPYRGCVFDVESWAHQLQRFVKVEGEWKLTRFEAIYIRDGVSVPWPQEGAEEVMREVGEGKTRESMRVMSWMMGLSGIKLRSDLPGYDDEGTWKPVVEKGREWLEKGE